MNGKEKEEEKQHTRKEIHSVEIGAQKQNNNQKSK